MEEGNKEMLEFMLIVLLADYDLMGLIVRGAPSDEYGPEARTILRYLTEENYNVKIDTLANRVQYTFLIWFDEQVDMIPCIMIANEIKKMI